ncbi:CPBP family intramembrane glutamic endopeptidase [Bacillus sp. 1P06AnD]|uniref:CPBP family intramembrane glutamic endopeptidase n=1 Tax=Bacillus sp. 1P06AnD TaxID=3132208 RepID=UPI0039A1626E
MKINKMNWKKQDCWGKREFVLLMVLEFVIVIGCIKLIVQPIYSRWLDNDLYAGTLIGLTIAITLTMGVYFIALFPKHLSWGEVGIKSFAQKDWIIIVFFSIIILSSGLVIIVLTSFLGDYSWENSKTEAIQQNITFHTVLIAFISAAIISPIYEEIFYRGFLYRWLRTRIGFIGAILVSSIIFTIVHFPALNVMPVNFLSGIVFALAYERTNSIWPSIFIHGLTNGIMVVLTSLG